MASALQVVNNAVTAIKDFIVNNITIKGRVEYEDHDTAGFAIIKAGATQMKVFYAKPYTSEPIVQITANGHSYVATIKDSSKDGFTIFITTPQDQDLRYNWSTIAVKDALTTEGGEEGITTPIPTSMTPSLTSAPVSPTSTETLTPSPSAAPTITVSPTATPAPTDTVTPTP